jgi:hypothetical protein
MRTPAGRAKKIAELVAMLARGDTIVPNTPPRAPPTATGPRAHPRRKAGRSPKK